MEEKKNIERIKNHWFHSCHKRHSHELIRIPKRNNPIMKCLINKMLPRKKLNNAILHVGIFYQNLSRDIPRIIITHKHIKRKEYQTLQQREQIYKRKSKENNKN